MEFDGVDIGGTGFVAEDHSAETKMENGIDNPAFSTTDETAAVIPVMVETVKSVKKSSVKFSSEAPRQIAVQVSNAFKAYGDGPPVLANYNMTVPRGTIYGLLGASGCGKTTILSCIVGLRKLDKGEIWVYGAKPGTRESGIPGKTVGYMPQEIALYENFSIEEILHYYGRIYGMKKYVIEKRMKFLAEFLDIPDVTRRVSSLSGGQQRRASLAVAMIHSPPLLILDEPTVGVDPLIRESIWEYLTKLVSGKRTTVIVTTHYIDEARASATVGIMRHGRLLEERSPEELLATHNCDLLEDIVLKLCKKDELDKTPSPENNEIRQALEEASFYSKRGSASNIDEPEDTVDELEESRLRAAAYKRKQSVIETMNTSFSRQTDKVMALTKKNVLNMVRNPMFLVIFIFSPVLQTIISSTIVGKPPIGKLIGLVNEEMNGAMMSGHCGISNGSKGCFIDDPFLSCHYLRFIENDETVILRHYGSEDSALRAAQRGSINGFVVIPENFTSHMKFRIIHERFAKPEDLFGSVMKVRLDFTAPLTQHFISKAFTDAYLNFLTSLATSCEGHAHAVQQPFKHGSIFHHTSKTERDYFLSSVILQMILVMPMTSALNYIWDKRKGNLDRTLSAGVDLFHVVVALLITEGSMILVEVLVCLTVSTAVLGFEIKGSLVLVISFMLTTGICGLAFGVLFGVSCDREFEALVMLLFLFSFGLTASGANFPLDGTSNPWIKFYCYANPFTLPLAAMRSIVGRGFGPLNSDVLYGYCVLHVWTVLCCVLSYFIHKKQK